MAEPTNRKQRRAAARDSKKRGEPTNNSAADIKLAHPDRSGPKTKTLLQIAEEKNALLEKGQPFAKEPGAVAAGRQMPEDEEDPLGQFGDAVMYSSTLTMLHFTLDVLVYNQYSQSIIWPEAFRRAATALPIMFILVYVMHGETAAKFPVLKQLLYLVVSIAAGCYMVYSGNMYGYYNVMKRAPPVGTLWVWSVIEMQLPFAIVGVAAVGGYLWFGGYNAF